MNSRNTTWEVIVAGCIFMALGVYLINPSDLSVPSPEFHNQQVQLDPPPAPEKPSVSETIMIKLKELENLEQLKELEQLQELEHLEKELKQLEKELKSQAPQPNMLSLPSFKILPKLFIYSP